MCIYMKENNLPTSTQKKKLDKVYRTIQESGLQAFTEPSSLKFKELFRMKCRTYKDFS